MSKKNKGSVLVAEPADNSLVTLHGFVTIIETTKLHARIDFEAALKKNDYLLMIDLFQAVFNSLQKNATKMREKVWKNNQIMF